MNNGHSEQNASTACELSCKIFLMKKDMRINKKLGHRVRNTRLGRRLGIVQLARGLDITHQALQQLETGRTAWSVNRLLAVSKVLDIPPALLLDGLVGKSKDLDLLSLSEEETELVLGYRKLSPQARAVIKAGVQIIKR